MNPITNETKTGTMLEQEALHDILKEKQNRVKNFIQNQYHSNDRIISEISSLNKKSNKITEEVAKVVGMSMDDAIVYLDETSKSVPDNAYNPSVCSSQWILHTTGY